MHLSRISLPLPAVGHTLLVTLPIFSQPLTAPSTPRGHDISHVSPKNQTQWCPLFKTVFVSSDSADEGPLNLRRLTAFLGSVLSDRDRLLPSVSVELSHEASSELSTFLARPGHSCSAIAVLSQPLCVSALSRRYFVHDCDQQSITTVCLFPSLEH